MVNSGALWPGKHKDKREKRRERATQRSKAPAAEEGSQTMHRPPTAAELAAVNVHRRAATASAGTATLPVPVSFGCVGASPLSRLPEVGCPRAACMFRGTGDGECVTNVGGLVTVPVHPAIRRVAYPNLLSPECCLTCAWQRRAWKVICAFLHIHRAACIEPQPRRLFPALLNRAALCTTHAEGTTWGPAVLEMLPGLSTPKQLC